MFKDTFYFWRRKTSNVCIYFIILLITKIKEFISMSGLRKGELAVQIFLQIKVKIRKTDNHCKYFRILSFF